MPISCVLGEETIHESSSKEMQQKYFEDFFHNFNENRTESKFFFQKDK